MKLPPEVSEKTRYVVFFPSKNGGEPYTIADNQICFEPVCQEGRTFFKRKSDAIRCAEKLLLECKDFAEASLDPNFQVHKAIVRSATVFSLVSVLPAFPVGTEEEPAEAPVASPKFELPSDPDWIPDAQIEGLEWQKWSDILFRFRTTSGIKGTVAWEEDRFCTSSSQTNFIDYGSDSLIACFRYVRHHCDCAEVFLRSDPEGSGSGK